MKYFHGILHFMPLSEALQLTIFFFPLSAVSFEMWHLELITGLIVLISSCRYLLLKTWPDFAESSEAANQQVTEPSHGSENVLHDFINLVILLLDCHFILNIIELR